MNKEACIIFSTKIGDGICLGKNRDRMYDSKIRIVRLLIKGTEVCLLLDVETGWCEGLNEHGIGIVNTALMVRQDEAEGKGGKGKGTVMSQDGPRIFKALSCTTLEEAVRVLCSYRGGVKGHTFVSDGSRIVSIEASRKHRPRVWNLDPGRINTRTNHGISYPDAGYTDGDDYVSSVVRRWQAQKALRGVTDPEKAMPAFMRRICDWDSGFNMVRETERMRTTSQMALDLANLYMMVWIIPQHCTFLGVENKLPPGYSRKIGLKVYRYNDGLFGEGSAQGVRDSGDPGVSP